MTRCSYCIVGWGSNGIQYYYITITKLIISLLFYLILDVRQYLSNVTINPNSRRKRQNPIEDAVEQVNYTFPHFVVLLLVD